MRKSIRKTILFCVFFVLGAGVGILLPKAVGQDGEKKERAVGYPDEMAAMAVLQSDSSLANREALAGIRYRHAIRMNEAAREMENEEVLELAIQYAISACKLVPDDARYPLLAARMFLELPEEDTRAAVMSEYYARRALEQDSENPDIHILLGTLLFQRQQMKAGLESYEAAVLLDPAKGDPLIVGTMVGAYVLTEQAKEGEAFFREVTAVSPELSVAKLAMVILMEEQGKSSQARELVEQVVADRDVDRAIRKHAARLREDMAGKEGAR